MILQLKAKHIAHATLRNSDFNLKFKLKTAVKEAQPDMDTLVTIDVTAAEIISTYSVIAALPKEQYEAINNEMKDAFMGQLLSNGQPINEEAGKVVSWIMAFRGQLAANLNNELVGELENLKS